ncbi:MAG: ribonuclease Z [Gloeobacteraceae cyanobacterium ES-bin-316]|nr:ribonuclease Z [Ferruginibacter sp.]
MIGLTILGNNSAIPAFGRYPTAQVLQSQDETYLIDCGEGTQLQLTNYKIKRSKINHVFISHMHGDHYFGLIGLISSMGLMGRTTDLFIYAPAPLKDIIELQLNAAHNKLPFKIFYHALGNECIVYNGKRISVESFKVNHRIDCWGFIFREKKNPRSIDPERVRAYEIPASFYEALQHGEDYTTKKGTIIPNEEVTTAASPSKSYAYCADTLYDESIAEKVKAVNLLYHEATYLQDLHERAKERFHSTTVQAGAIAKKAGVQKLIIGHFSSKYENLDDFLTETVAVFPNTELALQGLCFKI